MTKQHKIIFQTPYIKAYLAKEVTWLAECANAKFYQVGGINAVPVEPTEAIAEFSQNQEGDKHFQ